MEKPMITLDARMTRMSGIGRYIESILPLILERGNSRLLAYPGELDTAGAEIIPMHSRIYSPFEQWELFQKIGKTHLFWSPHFNTPFLPIPAGKRAVTIHDCFHLAPENTALSSAKKQYAKLLLRNAVRSSSTWSGPMP